MRVSTHLFCWFGVYSEQSECRTLYWYIFIRYKKESKEVKHNDVEETCAHDSNSQRKSNNEFDVKNPQILCSNDRAITTKYSHGQLLESTSKKYMWDDRNLERPKRYEWSSDNQSNSMCILNEVNSNEVKLFTATHETIYIRQLLLEQRILQIDSMSICDTSIPMRMSMRM